ncbi:hypothetical protein JCGZ_12772 [Jatropha curcas]|uniref:Uncharacterized protein n=1 Tax=Jatropha curcas TaxID=180498 RepID=A0A067LDT2_JATCU|nr:hypothetical protein JCGZ_12772 [Jatropha curcas]
MVEEVVCNANLASTHVTSHAVPAISQQASSGNQPSHPDPDLHHTSPPIINENLEDSTETNEDEDGPQVHADRQPQKSADGCTNVEPNGTTFFPYVVVRELAKIIRKAFGGPGPWYK